MPDFKIHGVQINAVIDMAEKVLQTTSTQEFLSVLTYSLAVAINSGGYDVNVACRELRRAVKTCAPDIIKNASGDPRVKEGMN